MVSYRMAHSFLECNFISPVSNHPFDKNKAYTLAYYNTGMDNSVLLNLMPIKNIDNVTQGVRSYGVGQSIKLFSSRLPYVTIKLFEFHNGKLYLLFSGRVDVNEMEMGTKKAVTLRSPTKVLNNDRQILYTNEKSFLSEPFFNFDTYDNKGKCVVFLFKTGETDKPVIVPHRYRVDLGQDVYVFDRYSQNAIREILPIYLSPIMMFQLSPANRFTYHMNAFTFRYCKKGNMDNYLQYVREYQIDQHKFTEVDTNTSLRKLITCPVNPNYRPLRYDPYINTMLISPMDGRVRGFHTKKDINFTVFNTTFDLGSWLSKPYEIVQGSGFIGRVNPNDYRRVHIPYAGFVEEVGIYAGSAKDKLPYVISIKITSDYFVPPSVKEREYASLILGDYLLSSRFYPELLDVQPDIRLVYNIVIVSLSFDDAFEFTNNKFQKIKQTVGFNRAARVTPFWIEQGEELGAFTCAGGYVVCLTNRKIDFASDIKYYSRLGDKQSQKLARTVDTYVMSRDIIGILL